MDGGAKRLRLTDVGVAAVVDLLHRQLVVDAVRHGAERRVRDVGGHGRREKVRAVRGARGRPLVVVLGLCGWVQIMWAWRGMDGRLVMSRHSGMGQRRQNQLQPSRLPTRPSIKASTYGWPRPCPRGPQPRRRRRCASCWVLCVCVCRIRGVEERVRGIGPRYIYVGESARRLMGPRGLGPP